MLVAEIRKNSIQGWDKEKFFNIYFVKNASGGGEICTKIPSKVLLGQALLVNPRLLVCTDVTSGLKYHCARRQSSISSEAKGEQRRLVRAFGNFCLRKSQGESALIPNGDLPRFPQGLTMCMEVACLMRSCFPPPTSNKISGSRVQCPHWDNTGFINLGQGPGSLRSTGKACREC